MIVYSKPKPFFPFLSITRFLKYSRTSSNLAYVAYVLIYLAYLNTFSTNAHWVTKEGHKVRIKNMSYEHLVNVLLHFTEEEYRTCWPYYSHYYNNIIINKYKQLIRQELRNRGLSQRV